MAELFDVEIITPDRLFYRDKATMVEMNTEAGEIGVYPRHIPLTTVLQPGIVTIHTEGEDKKAAIHAGFVEILPDKVTMLAEVAEWSDEIDVERAESARKRAEERIKENDDSLDLLRAEFALKKALIRIEAAERK